jgi:hypothetical protein
MPTSPEPEKTTPHEFAVPADENNDAKIRNQGQSRCTTASTRQDIEVPLCIN